MTNLESRDVTDAIRQYLNYTKNGKQLHELLSDRELYLSRLKTLINEEQQLSGDVGYCRSPKTHLSKV